MEYIIIPIVALVTSAVTLFSGFGLGTILLPIFAIFFQLDIAIALTAIVHFLNNLFKLVLIGKSADKQVVLRFGLPAILASLLGAQALVWLSSMKPVASYHLMGQVFYFMPIKLIVAVLMVFFALWEILPTLKRISISRRFLPLGGILSGLFGGLSGHQGALRSAFLLKSGLSEGAFIASGVVIAVLVDIPRISVYVSHFSQSGIRSEIPLLAVATLSAFTGAFIASRWIKHITLKAIQILVVALLFGVAVALGSGVI